MTASLALILMVALGGAAGGAARLWASNAIARRMGEAFPWGTLAVNVTGSALLGLLAAWLPPIADEAASTLWATLAIGVIGSYTTVSSFSLQTLALLRGGAPGRTLLYVAGSVALCIAAAAAGLFAGRLAFGG